MFKLTNEEVTMYPHMVLMHPADYAQLNRDKFDPFSCVYYYTVTGEKVWPTSPYETHPNWETPRLVDQKPSIYLTMNQMRATGRLKHAWREYPRKLNTETMFKSMYGDELGELLLVSTLELPGINSPVIGNFFCNNQTSTGEVYRNENDDRILLFSVPFDAEEVGLGESFDELPEDWKLSEVSAIIPPGEYVFGPGQMIPEESEPVTPLTLTAPYRANVVIDAGRWLMGVMLTKEK